MNTWGISGPRFLLLYVALLAVTVLVVVVARRRVLADPGEGTVTPTRLDPYEAAYLNGGCELVATTAVSSCSGRPPGQLGPPPAVRLAAGPPRRPEPTRSSGPPPTGRRPSKPSALGLGSRAVPGAGHGCRPRAAAPGRPRAHAEQRARYRARGCGSCPCWRWGRPGWRRVGQRAPGGLPGRAAARHRRGRRRAQPAGARRHRASAAQPAAAPVGDPQAARWRPPGELSMGVALFGPGSCGRPTSRRPSPCGSPGSTARTPAGSAVTVGGGGGGEAGLRGVAAAAGAADAPGPPRSPAPRRGRDRVAEGWPGSWPGATGWGSWRWWPRASTTAGRCRAGWRRWRSGG